LKCVGGDPCGATLHHYNIILYAYVYDDKHVVDGDCELLIELQHKLTSAAHFTSVWLNSEI